MHFRLRSLASGCVLIALALSCGRKGNLTPTAGDERSLGDTQNVVKASDDPSQTIDENQMPPLEPESPAEVSIPNGSDATSNPPAMATAQPSPGPTATPAPLPPSQDSFADIRPILVANCGGCHSEGGQQPVFDGFGRLRMVRDALIAQIEQKKMPPTAGEFNPPESRARVLHWLKTGRDFN